MVITFCWKTICLLAPPLLPFYSFAKSGSLCLSYCCGIISGFESRSHYNLLFTTPSPVSETFFTFEDEGGAFEGAAFWEDFKTPQEAGSSLDRSHLPGQWQLNRPSKGDRLWFHSTCQRQTKEGALTTVFPTEQDQRKRQVSLQFPGAGDARHGVGTGEQSLKIKFCKIFFEKSEVMTSKKTTQ